MRGLWNRFVPSLDGYIQDRLNNPIHLPEHGTIKEQSHSFEADLEATRTELGTTKEQVRSLEEALEAAEKMKTAA